MCYTLGLGRLCLLLVGGGAVVVCGAGSVGTHTWVVLEWVGQVGCDEPFGGGHDGDVGRAVSWWV